MNTESRNSQTAGRKQDSNTSSRDLISPPADYPADGPETLVVVRFGKMRHRGRFRCRTQGLIYQDRVVVQSERGIEIGEVSFDCGTAEEEDQEALGWVIRRVTDEDLEQHRELNEPLEPGPEFLFCLERIAVLELPMRLVDVERPFGGGKIIFYFTADGRVDFRALVRDLAKRYRTRIEMKQIGVRDEAKVLGDIADCGQELCCRTFLTRLQPVSMRMAKVQKTTLDPAKISGRCGRLKCCLRYEFDGYMALRAGLPRPGNRVRHQERSGVVVGVDVLSQLVTVQLDEGERLVVHAGQIQRETPAPPANGARADRPDRPPGSTGGPTAEKQTESAPRQPVETLVAPAKPSEANVPSEPIERVVSPPATDKASRPPGEEANPRGRRSGRKRGRGTSAPRTSRERQPERPPRSAPPSPDEPLKAEPRPESHAQGPESRAKKKGDESKRGRRRRRRGRPRKGPGSRGTQGNGKPSTG